ncbi:nitroreductase family protein [Arenicella xantha]|uniref:Nitroreductase n=1 Tax=Arenicella xantha TaxID=644221 RepID=A0A395JPV2_9GAMM|nr:nitroreductase family protein [Arenicella xantha]RBP51598.1 nitroreductase [Arenicella xantha]
MNSKSIDFSARNTDVDVDPLFVQRWSPRAFQAHVIEPAVMHRIMEAARWSPSCFNAQPWRLYTSTDASFDDFLSLLVEGNQGWAKDVSVIGFMVAERNFEHNGKPNSYHAFDAGAAWMSLTLQARMEGLYTHGMGGIKKDEVASYLKLDTEQSEVLMGFTIGKLADLDSLSDEQKANETPNDRKELSEIWQQI